MLRFGLLTVLALVLVAPAAQARPTITFQGDSLTVGARPYLAGALPGWKVRSFDAQVGRHYWDAWPRLRHQPLGRVVVYALGTNDWQSSLPLFQSNIRRVLRHIGPHRCLVMATIYDRRGIITWNRALLRLAREAGPGRMQIASWAWAVERGKVRLADGVHPARAQDWRYRARQLASAANTCLAYQH